MAIDVSGVLSMVGEVLIGVTAVGLAGLSLLVGISGIRSIRQMIDGGATGGLSSRQVAAIKAKQAAAEGAAEEALSFDAPEKDADLLSSMSDKNLWEYRSLVDSALNERASTMVIDGKEERYWAPDDAEAKRLMTESWKIGNEIETRTHGF
jgi:hypothetical protein